MENIKKKLILKILISANSVHTLIGLIFAIEKIVKDI
jgi:hypothetical protein